MNLEQKLVKLRQEKENLDMLKVKRDRAEAELKRLTRLVKSKKDYIKKLEERSCQY